MQAIYIRKHGGPEVLEVRQLPDPQPSAGQVRVKVHAAGLNFAEIAARQGLYPDAPKPPCVVGYEGAGVVDALGSGVATPAIGTRVLFLSHFGAHASSVCVPANYTFALPDSMSFEHGAALPVVYLTAYHVLFAIARLRRGEHVLVHMAAGGVGTAVLQLCRTVPDVVTYGTASASKHDYLRAQGCSHPIDYRSDDYAVEVRRLTNGRGVDFVLDPLGGRDWRKGYDLLKPCGMLIAYGFANTTTVGRRNLLRVLNEAMRAPWFNPISLMSDNRAVAGVNMGHLLGEQELLSTALNAIIDLYRDKNIEPHVHKTFPFSRAAEAHGELEHGRNIGKVLLTPD
jgi:NADPH:quinone reductase-like Zn-dependent oxidoreductase